MAEINHSKHQGRKAVAVNVRLKPVGQFNQPALVNYTHVGLAQGFAYVDFGFLEPALLSAIIQRVQQGEALPPRLEGARAARVALPLLPPRPLVLHRQDGLAPVFVEQGIAQTAQPHEVPGRRGT